VVMAAPDGFAKFVASRWRDGFVLCAALAWLVSVVVVTEMVYALQFDPHNDGLAHILGFAFDGKHVGPWLIAIVSAAVATLLTYRARNRP